MSQADPCRRALTPAEEARLFARDALRAAREALPRATDQGQAMMCVFVLLAVEALAPELVREGAGGVRPRD
ncbi:hypothetical protein E8E01_19330 [Methylorubrum populi]|uniref:hypothetical protein n=1 Tax=Methylorubrum populi TaxID=223967 RepID=UPI001154950B|nr:hypothetical protein [Methylorubrum populi]QDI82416.1 hypothetical protein E8E01_19330 [Methylorubrum populi]